MRLIGERDYGTDLQETCKTLGEVTGALRDLGISGASVDRRSSASRLSLNCNTSEILYGNTNMHAAPLSRRVDVRRSAFDFSAELPPEQCLALFRGPGVPGSGMGYGGLCPE